jgi:hypothetical protein
MSITLHFECYEPLIVPRTAEGVTFADLKASIAYHIPEDVDCDMDWVMFYDQNYRNIDWKGDDVVEMDFIHAIIIDNENLVDFYYEGPRHVVATWPWQMDTEGEEWLDQHLLELEQEREKYRDIFSLPHFE